MVLVLGLLVPGGALLLKALYTLHMLDVPFQ